MKNIFKFIIFVVIFCINFSSDLVSASTYDDSYGANYNYSTYEDADNFEKEFDLAVFKFDNHDYFGALYDFKKLYNDYDLDNEDKSIVTFNIGLSCEHLKDVQSAIYWYEKSFQYQPNEDAAIALDGIYGELRKDEKRIPYLLYLYNLQDTSERRKANIAIGLCVSYRAANEPIKANEYCNKSNEHIARATGKIYKTKNSYYNNGTKQEKLEQKTTNEIYVNSYVNKENQTPFKGNAKEKNNDFGENDYTIFVLIVAAYLIISSFTNKKEESKNIYKTKLKITNDEQNTKNEKWEKIREEVFETKGRKCALCGSTINLHVHHIIPLCIGGEDDIENLMVLCEKCHEKRHGFSFQYKNDFEDDYEIRREIKHPNSKSAKIVKAIKENRQIKIVHKKFRGTETERIITPITLYQEENNMWYLHAYCHFRKDYRIFKLSRISMVDFV